MPVLPKFGNHHARPAALVNGELCDFCFQLFPAFSTVIGGGIYAGDFLRVGAVAAIDLLQRIADFAHGGAYAHGINCQCKQVAGARLGSHCECGQCRSHLHSRPRSLDAVQPCNLQIAHSDVVDTARFNRVLGCQPVLVHADDYVLATVNSGLLLCGCGFDF